MNHYVTVVRKGEGPPPSSVDELAHKRIVLQRGDVTHEVLGRLGHDKQITFVETQEDMLRELAEGKVELRALRPDGTVRHGLTRGYAEQGADGKVISLYGTYQDITEYKLAQERIHHLNNVLRAIRDVNQLIVRERNRDSLILEACRLLVGNRGYRSSLIILTDSGDALLSWAQAGL